MSTNPPFLQRLNLDESADERAIRRAYARELKLIDQERNPAEFQELRELYEGALHWAREKIALMNVGAIDEPAAAVLAPEAIPAEDVAVAHKASPQEEDVVIVVDHEKIYQELEEFRLYANGLGRPDEHLGDLIMWQRKLDEILARPEFDNLHARGIFEANIIYQLANGWRPGHEVLFVAAAKLFRWREEPNRLRAFGEGGAIIDLAVLQYLMFEDLRGSPQYAHFRQAVARLRINKPPAIGELVTTYPYIEALAQHYPTWLSIVADVSGIEAWQKKNQDIPVWRKKYSVTAMFKAIFQAPKNMLNWHWSSKVYAFIVIIGVISGLSKPNSPPRVTPTSSNYSSYQDSGGNQSQPRIPSSTELARQVNPSTRTSLPEIVRVKAIYPEQSLLRKEEGQVMIRVVINELGKVDNVHVAKSSGFPLLDEAAVDAVKKGSFKPYIESGKPMASIATLPISFSLADYRK